MLPQLSTHFERTDVVLPMENLEAALCPAMSELYFYTAVGETQSDMPQSSWEAVLSEEVTIAPGYSTTGTVR